MIEWKISDSTNFKFDSSMSIEMCFIEIKIKKKNGF